MPGRMSRRVLIRLAIAVGGLLGLAAVGLAVLIVATSAPELPPPPLPTATPGPGPRSTPLAWASVLPTATRQPGPWATPLSFAPRLPTATPRPGPPLPLVASAGPAAGPNLQVRVMIANGQAGAAALTGLAYARAARPRDDAAPCARGGRWSLVVNLDGVVGRPYAAPPSPAEWARAARAIDVASAVCPVEIALTWYAHVPAHPATDTWTALLPAPIAVGIDGAALQRFAATHARQM